MARIVGNHSMIKLDATVPTEVVGCTSWEIDYKGEAIDTTGMDSAGAKGFIGGLTEASIAFECYEDAATPLNTDIAPGAVLLWQFRYIHDDAAAWHGSAIITDMKPSVTVEGAVKWSITGQATGTVHYANP
jgi:predicted secreted protein